MNMRECCAEVVIEKPFLMRWFCLVGACAVFIAVRWGKEERRGGFGCE